MTVSKTFIEQPLDAESWYLRLELPDGLNAWKQKQKFTIRVANEMLAAAEIDFINMLHKFREGVGDTGTVEDEPTLWLNDKGELKLTARCLMKLIPEESIDEAVAKLKEALKREEIYLRVKML